MPRELGMPIPREPVIFLKPPTALLAHEANIVYPAGVKRVDYEAELALVIGKPGRNIRKKDVSKHIFGYTCLNDVTARDLQKKDGQWTRAKSFDTFCPVGPWIETEFNPDQAVIRSFLNGKQKQCSTAAQFIFSVTFLVSWISRVMTLLPGDIISTGTPPGVGKLKPGDTVAVAIDGIGVLRNRVSAAPFR
jgi:2-keto-4-pentenoate hydratase/2-oxohepta-3-ene-1,7-dioic acid hydratase (catechol pathway)